MEQRYLRMEDRKPLLDLARNQNFAIGRGLAQKVEKTRATQT